MVEAFASAPTPVQGTGEDAVTDAADFDLPGDSAELREAEVDASGHGQRLDRWLVGMAPEFSRNHLQSLIERGCVHVDRVLANSAARKLRGGQQVRIELQPTEESRAY